jgi:hypothetical protein
LPQAYFLGDLILLKFKKQLVNTGNIDVLDKTIHKNQIISYTARL